MNISHELPLSLLSYSYEWNDYDYCLPHLLDESEQYRLFFLKSSKDKRFIIMDNGLYEGVKHTNEDLLEKINLIKPDIFIVPDAWNDSTTTIRSAKHWMYNYAKYVPEKTKLMAVLQGKSPQELIITYQMLADLGYDHIAINFSSEAYQHMFPGDDVLKAQMHGRRAFIDKLAASGTLRRSFYHHLLGCSLPQEFKWYKTGYDFIKSVDTSNPILVGAEKICYGTEGMTFKPKEKLAHYFEKDLSGQIENIKFNIQRFKAFVKG